MSDADDTPARPARRARRGAGARRGLPVWAVPVAVVIALLAAEGVARVVGPDLPSIAGTDQESVIKADQMSARHGRRTDLVFVGASETAAGLVPATVDQASSSFTGAYNAALRGASPELAESALSAIGARSRRMIESELGQGSEGIALADIMAARKSISVAAIRLSREGAFELPSTQTAAEAA